MRGLTASEEAVLNLCAGYNSDYDLNEEEVDTVQDLVDRGLISISPWVDNTSLFTTNTQGKLALTLNSLARQ